MTRKRLLLAALTASLARMLSAPAAAHACSMAGPTIHVVDASMQASDHVPPTLPAMPPTMIKRGLGPMQTGCGGSQATSCDDIGTIAIATRATDDVTPPERIGYRLTLETGTLPAGFTLPTDAIEPGAPDTPLRLAWVDGASDDQEPFAFTLRIVAIDLAGNESAPQTVRIADDPGHACTIARGNAAHREIGWLVGAALVLRARRRRG